MSDISEQKNAHAADARVSDAPSAPAERAEVSDTAETAQTADAAAATVAEADADATAAEAQAVVEAQAVASAAEAADHRENDASAERVENAQAVTAAEVDDASDASGRREDGEKAGDDASRRAADEHTRNVSEMFGRMTPWYDLQNRVFSLFLDCWWRHNLVNAVVPGPTGLVIDMASGTLDVALAIIRRYPELRVCATDICEPMLRYGEEHKIRAGERSRITTMVADARHMPLPDGCADAVTIAFGIRNVRPRMEALREMHRLLVPGGRACILEFAPVSTPLFGPAYHWYLRRIMPKLAGLVSRSTSAYDYFADTIENFPKPAAFSEELRQAGFAFVQHIPFTLGVANLHIAVRG